MLVYGDPQFQPYFRDLVGKLAAQVAGSSEGNLDDLRACLIQAGQLEQAAFDAALVHAPELRQITRITDLAAMTFYDAWARTSANDSAACLKQLQTAIRKLAEGTGTPNPLLTVKVPEGFEFYALFPEQYCLSALDWAAAHSGTSPRCVQVIGIRSIGTTLSAVVKAALKAAGWQVERRTVRPTGHPFARQVVLDETHEPVWSSAGIRQPKPEACPCALVVDEGPGLSGSSMVAVARVLAGRGIEDISFLPGHAGEPGQSASPEVRQCWAKTPRFVTHLEDLRWNGLSLVESLALESERMDKGASGRSVLDLSGGLWRQCAYPGEQEWPAVCPKFERMKFRCGNGAGTSMLWKFAGLGCWPNSSRCLDHVAWGRFDHNAQRSCVDPSRKSHCGFLPTRWLDGRRLTPGDALDSAVLSHVGRYVLEAAGPPLSPSEQQNSVSRLADMLYCNTKEACGERLAERTRSWATAALKGAAPPSYGDGRMAPWEWVCTRRGVILKTDCAGHDLDHTLVGKQSALWDVAGVLVEWKLNARSAARFLDAVARAGIMPEPGVLKFYEMAYAAFRTGMTTLAASQESDLAERKRLERALTYYRAHLTRCLSAKARPC